MRNRLTGIVSLVLALVMMSAAFCVPAYAKAKTITIHYQSMGEEEHRSFKYDDAFFSKSSYKFNMDLARISSGTAIAASKKNNITEFSKKAGFKKLWLSKELKEGTSEKDTIGTACMQKKIADSKGKCTLILLANRGSEYYSEWGGNAVMDASGDHKNFTVVKNKALLRLKNYIKDTGIKGRIKVWILGFSRSGGVANLMGGALDDGYDLGKNVKLARSDLFVYTFEAPRCAMVHKVKHKKYDNIKNLENSADIVQSIPFKSWGFARYGKDHFYPRTSDRNYAKYEAKFLKDYKKNNSTVSSIDWPYYFQGYKAKKIVGNAYIFVPSNITPEQHLKKLEYAMTHYLVSSREEFVNELQTPLSDALFAVKDENFTFNAAVGAVFFAKKISSNWKKVVMTLITSYDEAIDLVLSYLTESFKEAGASDKDAESLKKAVFTAAPMFAQMAAKDPGTTATFLANIFPLMGGHFPGVGISWLLTLPDGYMEKHSSYSWK